MTLTPHYDLLQHVARAIAESQCKDATMGEKYPNGIPGPYLRLAEAAIKACGMTRARMTEIEHLTTDISRLKECLRLLHWHLQYDPLDGNLAGETDDYQYSKEGMLDLIDKTLADTHQTKLSAWQPIETEPTDGEQYLVTDGSCVIMAEHPNEERIEHDITSCGVGTITHWMRLPEPPSEDCPICGDHHQGSVPLTCQTGDGV